MKNRFLVLAGTCLVAASTFGVHQATAQKRPINQAAPQSRAAQQSAIEQKAESLTEAQINESRDVPQLSKLAQLYNSIDDMPRFSWALRRITELMPDSGQLKLQLALVYADQKDLTRAYDVLVHMQSQGFGYDISKDERFANIHGTKVWDYLIANLQANAKQFGEGQVAFTLPNGDYLFDSIGYDPARKQFLVGSVREGKIYRADESGKLTDFITADAVNGMWAVLDIAVDSAHDKLYVASAGVPLFKHFDANSFAQSGVFEFQLSSGKFLNKYILQQPGEKHLFSHLVVSKDGRLYVADGDRRQIFKLDGGQLKLLTENVKLTGIRGMALSGDGKTLYFADYSLGIFGIDLTKNVPFVLSRNPEKLVLGGIEGMYFYDGCLVIIESGMLPQRVMRLRLTADGRGVSAAMPLDVAQPAFSTPSLGTVVGDQLYFVANSQRDLYDKYGVLKDPSKLVATKIFRSNLRFAWDQAGIAVGMSEIPKAHADDAPAAPMKKPQE